MNLFRSKNLTQQLIEQRDALTSVTLPFYSYSNKNAIGLSAFFAATNLISNSIAMMPIHERQVIDNKSNIIESSSIANLFYNMRMTKFNVFKKLVEDIIVKGNGYMYIKKTNGIPTSLVYLRPPQVTINWNEVQDVVTYTVSTSDSVPKRIIPESDMLHFIMHTNDGVNGISIINYASRVINLANSTEQSASEYFGSGCAVKGLIKLKTPLTSDKQRNEIRANWTAMHGDNSSGIAVLSGVEDFTAISNNADDSQMLETRQYNTTEIARFFNISPVLLGDLSHTSYNDIEQANLEFVQHCLLPWIEMFQNELTRKLIQVPTNYIDLDESVILKGNKASISNYVKTLVSGGIMTPNEARRFIDLNPMTGADDLIIPYTNVEQNTINSSEDEEIDTEETNDESDV